MVTIFIRLQVDMAGENWSGRKQLNILIDVRVGHKSHLTDCVYGKRILGGKKSRYDHVFFHFWKSSDRTCECSLARSRVSRRVIDICNWKLRTQQSQIRLADQRVLACSGIRFCQSPFICIRSLYLINMHARVSRSLNIFVIYSLSFRIVISESKRKLSRCKREFRNFVRSLGEHFWRLAGIVSGGYL